MTAPTHLVLDTNTILALWMFRDPALAPLRSHVDSGAATLVSRADALEELRRVLDYRQFALAAEDQARLLAHYQARCQLVPQPEAPLDGLPACRDPDDQKFLEIAATGAEHLISRDKALLRLARHRLVRERFTILTPERWQAEFLAPSAAV